MSSKKNIRKKDDCMNLLKDKISKNMKEYKDGFYSSRQQAIAVSYSQVKKMSPYCSRYMTRKTSPKRSRKVSRKSSPKRSRKVSRKSSPKRSRKVSRKRSRKMSRK